MLSAEIDLRQDISALKSGMTDNVFGQSDRSKER
jgi:hypothetical protein